MQFMNEAEHMEFIYFPPSQANITHMPHLRRYVLSMLHMNDLSRIGHKVTCLVTLIYSTSRVPIVPIADRDERSNIAILYILYPDNPGECGKFSFK